MLTRTTSGRQVTGLTLCDETIRRLPSHGDNWHMSWAEDGKQLVSLCDGLGLTPERSRVHNSRLFRIIGGPEDLRFDDALGFPDLSDTRMRLAKKERARYYGFGILALDGAIYQYLSTFNHRLDALESVPPGELRFVGAKLIYSLDDGATWRNQNGSTPVDWEGFEERSPQTMVFFEESQQAFSLLTCLQMGRGYADNSDGFVYVYAPNGNTEGTMNELVMFRVPKERILERHAYEFYAGGSSWSRDIDARAPVHTFPRGWVNRTVHPYAWQPSVVYNQPLGLYVMANWGMGCTEEGDWFGKPSYLGFWVAEHPWGPWEQIHEETSWTPGDDADARCYQPQIAPKWIAPDGESFWLVWTDFQSPLSNEEFSSRLIQMKADGASQAEAVGQMAEFRPYYAFNMQRVDVTLV